MSARVRRACVWRGWPPVVMLRLALSAIAAMAISAAGVRAEAPLTVFSAASTKTALDAVAAEFTDRHGTEIVPVYAGSSALARQIAAGAPADLFLSANRDWMDTTAAPKSLRWP